MVFLVFFYKKSISVSCQLQQESNKLSEYQTLQVFDKQQVNNKDSKKFVDEYYRNTGSLNFILLQILSICLKKCLKIYYKHLTF